MVETHAVAGPLFTVGRGRDVTPLAQVPGQGCWVRKVPQDLCCFLGRIHCTAPPPGIRCQNCPTQPQDLFPAHNPPFHTPAISEPRDSCSKPGGTLKWGEMGARGRQGLSPGGDRSTGPGDPARRCLGDEDTPGWRSCHRPVFPALRATYHTVGSQACAPCPEDYLPHSRLTTGFLEVPAGWGFQFV